MFGFKITVIFQWMSILGWISIIFWSFIFNPNINFIFLPEGSAAGWVALNYLGINMLLFLILFLLLIYEIIIGKPLLQINLFPYLNLENKLYLIILKIGFLLSFIPLILFWTPIFYAMILPDKFFY